MPDFSTRASEVEWMDTEVTNFEDYRACLLDLARVNQRTFAYRPSLAFLDRLYAAKKPFNAPLTILDVGSGYGDMLRRVALWAEKRAVPVSLIGMDLHPWSFRAAQEASSAFPGIRWECGNVFTYKTDTPVDIILSALFTHHLRDEEIVRFLSWMEAHAKLGWFIHDLHRHPIPYHVFKYWAKWERWHRFVQHDGPLSIARAFTKKEWRQLLNQTAMHENEVHIEWWMPFKLCLSRIKQR